MVIFGDCVFWWTAVRLAMLGWLWWLVVGFDGVGCFDSVYLVGFGVFGDALCSCGCGFL